MSQNPFIFTPVARTSHGPGKGHGTLDKPLVIWDDETYLCFDQDDLLTHLYNHNPITDEEWEEGAQ